MMLEPFSIIMIFILQIINLGEVNTFQLPSFAEHSLKLIHVTVLEEKIGNLKSITCLTCYMVLKLFSRHYDWCTETKANLADILLQW